MFQYICEKSKIFRPNFSLSTFSSVFGFYIIFNWRKPPAILVGFCLFYFLFSKNLLLRSRRSSIILSSFVELLLRFRWSFSFLFNICETKFRPSFSLFKRERYFELATSSSLSCLIRHTQAREADLFLPMAL